MVGQIDPVSGRPVYRQIADHLRHSIVAGDLVPGGRLPSEAHLVDVYGVSRVTARRALSVLVVEGLAVAEHGRGWFVKPCRPRIRLSSDRFVRHGADEAVFMVGVEAGQRGYAVGVVAVGRQVPPAAVRNRLGLNTEDLVVVRTCRYLVDGQPVEVATSYVPVNVAGGTPIEDLDPGPGGIYARIVDQGLVFTRFEEEISVRMPTEQERLVLGLSAGSPIFHIVRAAIASGQVIEVCDIAASGAAFVLLHSVDVDAGR